MRRQVPDRTNPASADGLCTLAALALAVTGLGCGGATEPTWEGLAAGRFDLVIPPQQQPLSIAAPSGHPDAGECVVYQNGWIVIDGLTELRLVRVFGVNGGVPGATYRDTLAGTYDAALRIEYGTHADTAHRIWAGVEENLYLRQLFPGSAQCAEVRRELRYRRAPVQVFQLVPPGAHDAHARTPPSLPLSTR